VPAGFDSRVFFCAMLAPSNCEFSPLSLDIVRRFQFISAHSAITRGKLSIAEWFHARFYVAVTLGKKLEMIVESGGR
jgi:hypothetical protein